MFYFDGKVLRIMNYNRINSLDENKIDVVYLDGTIVAVSGSDLKIVYLEPSELHLVGNIEIIKKIDKNEKD